MATHLLSAPELGHVDKFRSGKLTNADGAISNAGGVVFTANAGGTTTTLVGATANVGTGVNTIRVGERFVLRDSTGALKEPTVFTVTVHAVAASDTITFTPAAAAATASGDQAVLVSGDPYADNASLDQKLLAMGGVYTQAYIDHMTQNDKIYAIRQFENPSSVK